MRAYRQRHCWQKGRMIFFGHLQFDLHSSPAAPIKNVPDGSLVVSKFPSHPHGRHRLVINNRGNVGISSRRGHVERERDRGRDRRGDSLSCLPLPPIQPFNYPGHYCFSETGPCIKNFLLYFIYICWTSFKNCWVWCWLSFVMQTISVEDLLHHTHKHLHLPPNRPDPLLLQQQAS